MASTSPHAQNLRSMYKLVESPPEVPRTNIMLFSLCGMSEQFDAQRTTSERISHTFQQELA